MSDHVRRHDLPWRTATTTECGEPMRDKMILVDRDDLHALITSQGVQGAVAAGACPACVAAVQRWPLFGHDPVRALAREYADHDPRFAAELRALGVLAATHREEFDTLMVELAKVVDVAEARRRRQRR